MSLDWFYFALIGGAIDAGAAYLVYKWQAWTIDRRMKRMNPTAKNGLNLDLSYRIDGNEVFGIHGRGTDFGDLIDNMVRSFNTWTQKKDEKMKEAVNPSDQNK
jgi:hypothetical protein